jgi:hypothetical protein
VAVLASPLFCFPCNFNLPTLVVFITSELIENSFGKAFYSGKIGEAKIFDKKKKSDDCSGVFRAVI